LNRGLAILEEVEFEEIVGFAASLRVVAGILTSGRALCMRLFEDN
jgi:hypothetical protein